MSETKDSVADFLISLAGDIKSGKPILSALDELDEALDKWMDEFDDDDGEK